MKKLGAIALLLSLGMFTLGCEAKKGDAGGAAGGADATTTDTGADDAGTGDATE